MTCKQWVYPSVVGPIFLSAKEDGLCGVHWQRQNTEVLPSLDQDNSQTKILRQTVRQLSEYFSGLRQHFDLPLVRSGTQFQMKVWKELEKIPYGQTLAYRDIARLIEKGNAHRAVGTANARNPLSIIVPCHRVIAADGSLGGYAGGLLLKQKLLELEGI